MKFSLLAFVTTLLAALPATVAASDWLQFGYDPTHSGNNAAETTINASNVNSLVQVYSAALPSSSMAAPVYLSAVATSSGTKDLLFVTLTDGHIVAVDAANGAIVWSRQPPPVAQANGGNQGEAASPAIDPNRMFVYSYGLDGYVHKYAVGDGTESVTSPWPVRSTRKPDVEHGASALAIGIPASGANYLYAVTNGFNGDGGDYQGHVTTINLATGISIVFNANCSKLTTHFIENGTPDVNDCATKRSGIWGRPGAVYDVVTNRMYVATANGNYNGNVGGYNWGDSVLALKANGRGDGLGNPIDSYTPTNYMNLDLYDIDLGSGSLAIVPAPATSTYPHLGAMMGKDAVVRLLNLSDMSGNHGPRFVGGELQALSIGGAYDQPTPQAVVWVNRHGDGSTWVYESPAGSLTALQLSVNSSGKPSLVVRWFALTTNAAASAIVANDIIYSANNYDSIQALDPTSGNVLWSSSGVVACCGWGAPIVVNSRLYVLGSNVLTVFALDSIFKDGFD